jgi:hypothetical protein
LANDLLSGNWLYRSFINSSTPVGGDANKALALIFGEGQLKITLVNERIFKAVLDFGGGAAMDLYGSIIAGSGVSPQALQITGTGREGTSTDKWVYQYQGYVVPDWPEGVNQTPAIVGTAIRTIPHGTGKAGVVVSFVALKQS